MQRDRPPTTHLQPTRSIYSGVDTATTLQSRPFLVKAGAVTDDNGLQITGWFKCSEVVLALAKMGVTTTKHDLVAVVNLWRSHDPGSVLEAGEIRGISVIRAKHGHTWPGILPGATPLSSEATPVNVFVGVAGLHLSGGLFGEIEFRKI